MEPHNARSMACYDVAFPLMPLRTAADLGEAELRGFEDPVKLWELRWQEQG